jgi:hypothetical protein
MISSRLVLSLLSFASTPFIHADAPATFGLVQPATEIHGSASRRVSAVVAALDVNRDGALSQTEIAHASVLLRALDVNEDGILTVAELRGEPAYRRSGAPEGVTRTSRSGRSGTGFTLAFTLDANHDGDIQTMEIANAASSLRTLDLNRDGQLTADELRFEITSPATALAMAN